MISLLLLVICSIYNAFYDVSLIKNTDSMLTAVYAEVVLEFIFVLFFCSSDEDEEENTK